MMSTKRRRKSESRRARIYDTLWVTGTLLTAKLSLKLSLPALKTTVEPRRIGRPEGRQEGSGSFADNRVSN
jgi:hypothetical protein